MSAATSLHRRKTAKPMDPRRWLLQQNAYELLQKLEAAGTDPQPEVVHRLRTGTRRSGALLESILTSPGRSSEFRNKKKDAHKLLRQWKKLRRAAGLVRDLDVHLDSVDKLKRGVARSNPTKTQRLHEQFNDLKIWLKQQRDRRASKLQHVAKRRLGRCKSLTLAVLGEAPTSPAPAEPSAPGRGLRAPAVLALDDFYQVSEANAMLSPENLHDFRKSTKQARYVAEAGRKQPDAVAVDTALKRIQDTIGAWHDLDALQAKAAKALGKRGCELEDLLRDHADRKMHLAIQSTERMRRKLLGERLALRSRGPDSRNA